jgi:chemotaxis protein CheD
MATLSVGLAEMKFSRTPGDLIIAHGLGSCVGVALYDKLSRLGGMVHVVLPDSTIQHDNTMPERFADSAIPLLIQKFKMLGGNVSMSFVKICGGSNMFAKANISSLNIGQRNVEAVIATLQKEGLRPLAQDVGGTNGRTFTLEIGTGRVLSRMIGMQEREI